MTGQLQNTQNYIVSQQHAALAAQSIGNGTKLSELDQFKLRLTDALGFLGAQATALEEIYGKLSGDYPPLTASANLQPGAPVKSGHVSEFSRLCVAIHERITTTDALIAKLDAVI